MHTPRSLTRMRTRTRADDCMDKPTSERQTSRLPPVALQVAASLVSSLCPGDMRASEQLYESGGLVMFSEQLNSNDTRAQLQALSALSQLSANPQQAGAIVENGCVPPILELLDHPSQELTSYAAITFGNLCSSGAIPQRQLEHRPLPRHAHEL